MESFSRKNASAGTAPSKPGMYIIVSIKTIDIIYILKLVQVG